MAAPSSEAKAAEPAEAKSNLLYEWAGDGRLFNGKLAQADGSNSIVEPSSAAYKLTEAFTLMIWAKPTKQFSDWNRLFGKGAEGPRNYGIWLSPNRKAQILSQIYKPGNPTSEIFVNNHIECDAWTHLAVRYLRRLDGWPEEHQVFVNGVKVMKPAEVKVSPTGKPPLTSDDPLTIGAADFHTGFIGCKRLRIPTRDA